MKLLKIVLCLSMFITLAACSKNESVTEETETVNTVSLLDDFAANEYKYHATDLDAFSTKAEDAPSDEELVKMLDFAMVCTSAHGLTPAHFVVIRNVEDQKDILSGLDAFHLPNPASEGTVTVLVLADDVRDDEHHKDDYNGWYSQMYYGIYDAGGSANYLSLAAQTMGYATHFVAGLNIPLKETGEVNVPVNGGNFALVNGEYWDVDKYLSSKDGSVDFVHTVSQGTFTGDTLTVSAKGNLTLLTALVIGKLDESVDAKTGATDAYPENLANYNFYDPQDGASYGNSVEAGSLDNSNDIDLSAVADGTYTADNVTVEVKDNKIVTITVDGELTLDAESLKNFTDSIINAQSINVDGVAGATNDCKAIVEAIKAALK